MNTKFRLLTYLCLLCHCYLPVSTNGGEVEEDLGMAEFISRNQQPQTGGHIKESVEFQAINSYLTSLEPLTTNNAIVVAHLNDAIHRIELLLNGVVPNLNPLLQEEPAEFKFLLGNDLQTTLSIMRSFVKASNSCEQSELDFLVLVTKQETFEGQFLNKYASAQLEKCWTFNLDTLALRIDRSVGKMSSAIFEFMAELGNRLSNLRAKERQKKRGTLTIMDQDPANDPAIITEQLKQVTFESPAELRSVASSLNGMYKIRLQAERDEKMVAARMKNAFGLLANYGGHLPSAKVRKTAIETRRRQDPSLDYYCEIYRICKRISSNSSNLWDLLSRMH